VELVAIGSLVTMPMLSAALPGKAIPGVEQGKVQRVVMEDGPGVVVRPATTLVGGVRAAA